MGTEPANPRGTRRVARVLWRLARVVGLCYLGVIVVLMFLENWMVYHPYTAAQDWQKPPHADIVDIELTSADGTTIHAWWLPCAGSDTALLYFHGNAGNLSHRGNAIVNLRKTLETNVLIIDYPGYGKSAGRPSEAGCYAAADAAYDWLTQEKKIDPKQLTIFGKSLGGGVAVELASRREHRALVLVRTFTSLPDVGQSFYPWLPVRWIMRNRYDSIGRIRTCHRPVFVGHGTEDTLIPFIQGKRLFEAANEPKQFLTMPGGHNDPLPDELFSGLKKFLDQHPTLAAAM